MQNNALYVYGLVKSRSFLYWEGLGIQGNSVYTVNKGEFSAFVHKCDEKPYTSEEPNKIKRLIIEHNQILNKAVKPFGGIIPLQFNTIIKNGKSSSEDNLKNWINDNKEKLEKTWNKVKGKNEYGIRIYYEKDLLMQETLGNKEIKNIEKGCEGKSKGLSYLLKGKAESKIKDIFQNEINQSKHKFYDNIRKVTEDAKINTSRIFVDKEKDLLLSLSILADKLQIKKIKEILKQSVGKNFSFHLAGPFPPYSFTEDETK